MSIFHEILNKLPQFRQLEKTVAADGLPAMVIGLSSVHKAHFLYRLSESSDLPLLVLTDDEVNAKKLSDDYNQMAGGELSAVYPAKDFTFRPIETVSREYEYIRLNVLSRIVSRQVKVVFAGICAAMQYTLPPSRLLEATHTIRAGQELPVGELVGMLAGAGYTRRAQVDGSAQYSVRGGIVDFFPTSGSEPVRVEFWGDEIDTISFFELDSQRRTTPVEEIEISPATEIIFSSPEQLREGINGLIRSLGSSPQADAAKLKLSNDIKRIDGGLDLSNIDKYIPLAYDRPATLFDYFESPLLFVSEWSDLKESARAYEFQYQEDLKILLEEGELCKGLDSFVKPFASVSEQIAQGKTVFFDTFAHANHDLRLKELITVNAMQTSSWSGDLKLLCEDLADLRAQSYSVIIMTGTQKAADVLAHDLEKEGIPSATVVPTGELTPGVVYVLAGMLSSGFEYPAAKVALITHARIQNLSKRKVKRRKGEEIRSLSDINVGDFVVHVSHGIGVFEGITNLNLQGVSKDYIKIKYKGSDVLYVPVTQLDMVSKYIGPKENGAVRLNRLNSDEWNKTRSRVKKAVAEMADELIRLYAERAKTKGYAFSKDNEWQREFEDHFEYEETEDQLRCIEEIKADMESDRPMERLLCGDVGFGKTEVALRAAFKCVLDSKQCAILCPTTILAWQHYQTALARIGNFPVNIELLSRFRTPKEQKQVLQKLRTGQVDIIIGTHRLVQKDVAFSDLGLAIIDEEQRFGVTHKERFKEMFRGVDVLTLSATPIPRTLNMAMSGIRDMSVIEQAPQDRHPIQTYVIEHDYGVIADAIKRELRRDGQVYYIHNRVESIQSCAAQISKLVPDARIGIAHGKMGENELSRIWQQLMEHEIDILVCTTIIETGVDVSNCNTLIIEDADNMGLSQLYQLRGRVGRSKRRASAYFTFRRGKVLTEIASKRLSAIREFTKFGSGFRIALRDLEIRGAGSILGERQHGHMEAVGYDMYLRLLSDAVSEKQGVKPPTKVEECLIDLPMEAHIPEDYIENLAQRLDIYRKIASLESHEQSLELIDELIDRFGDPPKSVQGLIDIALLRAAAAKLGFTEISQKGVVMLFFPKNLDMEVASRLAAHLKGRVMVNAGQKPHIAVKMKGSKPLDVIREVLFVSNPT